MNFWRAVMSDENGIPDEVNVLLFVVVFALIGGALLIAFGKPFPLETLGAIVVTLLNLYKAMRGDFRAKPTEAQ